MKYFEKFVSNTTAGCGNQLFFLPESAEQMCKGRIYLKIFKPGTFDYSLLYSNVLDSTYSDGSIGHKNLVCDEWYIDALRVAVTTACQPQPGDEQAFIPLTFGGNTQKTVAPGEFFYTDPCRLSVRAGEYLCVEMVYHGKQIPYHPESQVAIFDFKDGTWTASSQCPVPSMVGCDRPVKKRIGYFGDSITQGIGATFNSYRHYAAKASDLLGDEFSYWDLGIGFARADDAASDGAWMFKAKQVDIITVCFGVNDIYQGFSEEQIKANLKKTVTALKQAGVKVILQTVPPFDYTGEHIAIWNHVNQYIKEHLVDCVDAVLDTGAILSVPENPQNAQYGGHPDDEGCLLWAQQLAPVIKAVARCDG
nr:SGNH/GDSL hydrolase family protein [bacterium]